MKRVLKNLTLIFCIYLILLSCNTNTGTLTATQFTNIRDSVQQMMNSIAKDISGNGPIAWLQYFETTPNFFMASDGLLAFPNGDSATSFITKILVKKITKIDLQWSNIRIDALTPVFANVAANWHEKITDANGSTISESGYFTGVAEKSLQGWKLRNAHWSVVHSN
ncbi:MAG: hypothetical protein JST75_21230 [Bacteroidetes bacterium]|nr:hypothetical protein [Bacteroidota bacterium]